jgi:predicted anti-sigma-YlaC factor YlaD
MRYDCRDIERLLESDERVRLDLLEEHLAQCLRCRKLTQLDPEVEGHLQTRLPGSLSSSICGDVMKAVTKEAGRISAERRVERLLPFAVTSLLCVIITLVTLKWNQLKSLIFSIDLTFLGTLGQGLLSKVKLPAVSIEKMISFMGNEPLLFAAGFAVASLVWALSLLELEKTPK